MFWKFKKKPRWEYKLVARDPKTIEIHFGWLFFGETIEVKRMASKHGIPEEDSTFVKRAHKQAQDHMAKMTSLRIAIKLEEEKLK